MKKFFVFLFLVILALTALVVVAVLSPGESGVKWLSVQFSETLKEQNELIVYSGEKTGIEIYQRNAPIVGTIQEVEMPYTFSFEFSVDLSKAVVDVNGKNVTVHVPGPRLYNYKMSVVDSDVERSGALMVLPATKYTEIKQGLESRLLAETQSNEAYVTEAWNVTVRNLTNLLTSVAQTNDLNTGLNIQIIRDDTLLVNTPAATESNTVPVEVNAPGTTALPSAM